MFDYIIKKVSILDGSGSPAFCGDIAVKDGKIAGIGNITGDAENVIDGSNLIASPGFVDFHSHTDASLLIDPRSESKITQGITLEVNGNCGDSFEVGEDKETLDKLGIDQNWKTLGGMYAAMEKHPISVNFATLIGHANIRAAVVGYAAREASPKEIDEMKALAVQAMEEGAFGISTGLIYPPSAFGNTAELIELAKAVAPYGGIYASHIRSESSGLVDAVEEALQIGKQSGAAVQISHHKACEKANWGKVNVTLAMIRECREIGMDVTADQYPYTASSTGLTSVLPNWAHDGGHDAIIQNMKTRRKELIAILKQNHDEEAWSNININYLKSEKNLQYMGLDVLEISRQRKMTPEETALTILAEENLNVGAIFHTQCEDDVKAVMRSDFSMFGTDATARAMTGIMSEGKPHPRSFGTFPRVLGRYVREQGVIPIEKAIMKMTSLATKKLGIQDRGMLKIGNWADIVLFDPETVRDLATYDNPHQISSGIEYVFVNGKIAVKHGKLTGVLAGQLLRKNKK